jgi:hypothetical protein
VGSFQAGKERLAIAAELNPFYKDVLEDPYWEEEYGK